MYKIIIKREMKAIIREKGLFFILYFFLPILIFASLFYKVVNSGQIEIMGVLFINFSVTSFTISWFLLFSMILIPDVFYRDKMKKILESLLTTPLSISDILIGKTLTISILSLFIIWIEQIIIVFSINIFFTDGFTILPTLPAILICLLITPLLGFSTVLMIGVFIFNSNKFKIFKIVFPMIVFGLFFLTSSKIQLFQPDWTMFIIEGILAIVLLTISLLLVKSVKKEDIVLSIN